MVEATYKKKKIAIYWVGIDPAPCVHSPGIVDREVVQQKQDQGNVCCERETKDDLET
jgi:hypothetical protein